MEIRDERDKNWKGTWNLDSHETRSAPVLDPMVGQDRVIRHFFVHPDPSKPEFTPEETLFGVLPIIKKNVIKDGWTFEREPEIHKLQDGFRIITVLRPAVKNGMIIGATNNSPQSATKLLEQGNRELQKLKEEKKKLERLI